MHDLIIIGAGPAGLMLARCLPGFDILILDKKKEASDVAYHTLGTLMEPEAWGLPYDIFHPLHEVRLHSKNEHVVKSGKAYVADRKKLLMHLEKTIPAEIQYNATVTDVAMEGGMVKHICYMKDGKEHKTQAKLYADCSGLGNVIGRKSGLAPAHPTIAIGAEYLVPLKQDSCSADLFLGSSVPGGYGWIFPCSKEHAIIGYGTLTTEYFSSCERYLQEMWNIQRVKDRCEMRPLDKKIAAIRTGQPLDALHLKNHVIVGDSALQANPLLGEGVRFVMDSALIAAKHIRSALQEDDNEKLEGYTKEWKGKYYKRYELCYRLQKKIQQASIHDGIMDTAIRILQRTKNEDFLRLLGGDLSYSFLARAFGSAVIGKIQKR